MISPEHIWRHESQVSLSGIEERYCRSWQPPDPKRVMVVVHGYAEHSGRYDEMAMHFAQRGFAVHAYDQIGHGRTAGPRGHADRFDHLIDDLIHFLEIVSKDHSDLPMSLVGHSMGGLVVAAAVAFRKPQLEKVVLSGALLQLGSKGDGLRQSLSLGVARVLSVFAPRLAIATGLDVQGISRDPEVIRRYQQDPFVEDRMSVRFAAGMSQMVRAMSTAASEIETPILVMHGGDDPICPESGSHRLFANLRTDVARQSQLEIYPELRHEIFQEPERERVWQDMIQFIER